MTRDHDTLEDSQAWEDEVIRDHDPLEDSQAWEDEVCTHLEACTATARASRDGARQRVADHSDLLRVRRRHPTWWQRIRAWLGGAPA